MDIETYKLSRTFLFRHHTLRLIRDILNTAGGGNGVPAHKCTPQWFLEQYFLHHAYPSRSKWQRINFLEGVESAVESSDEGSGIDAPPDAQTHTPRLLRTIHKNEVWSIFGSHSEWILSLMEKHKDLKGKVNTQSWKYFIMHVPQLRQRALFNPDTDGKWGLKDEQGDQVDTSYIPPSSPPLPKAAVSQPQNHKGQKYKKKKPSTKVSYFLYQSQHYIYLLLRLFLWQIPPHNFPPEPLLLPLRLRLKINWTTFMTQISHKAPYHHQIAILILGFLIPLLFTPLPLTLLSMPSFPMRCSLPPPSHLICSGTVLLEALAHMLLTCMPLQVLTSGPSVQLSPRMKLSIS